MNVGIIGYGRAAHELHLPALAKISSAKVVMACDVNSENLARARAAIPELTTTSNFEELIAHSDIDIVAVLTPAHLHTEIAIRALEAGKHILVEKPLALSVAECDRLLQAEAQSAAVSQVGFNLRFHRLLVEARRLVKEGAVGNIEAVRSQVTGSLRQKPDVPEWRKRRELGGSPLFEIGIHHFDLWRWITGEPISTISARARMMDGIERTVSVSAETGGGVVLSGLFSDWTADSNQIEIFGDQGLIRVSIYRIDGLHYHNTQSVAGGISTRFQEMRQILSGVRSFPRILSLGGDFRASYYFEWLKFLRAINGDEKVSPALTEGKYATRVALAATHSVDIDGPVDLKNALAEFSLDKTAIR